MSPNDSLTPNAIQRIHAGIVDFHPVMQVLEARKITPNTANPTSERWRLLLSDGEYTQSAMLGTQLNFFITTGQIQNHCLIRLNEFICNEVQQRKIIIILKLDVVSGPVDGKIGNPIEYGKEEKPVPMHQGGGGGGGGYNNQQSGAGSLNTMQGASIPAQSRPTPMQQDSHHDSGSSYSRPANNSGGGYQAQRPPQQSGGYGGSGAASSSSMGGGYNRQHSAPVQREEPNVNTIPIDMLNPYQNRWTIKARVTAKSDMRRWSNARGEGTLFSIDLLDDKGGEIRGTFFKDAAEKFFNLIESGKVYTFSGGKLKVANKQFSSLKNQYEITFDNTSEIRPVADDESIQHVTFNFKKIEELESVAPNTTVDLIGILKDFTAESTILTKKDQREVSKRDLTLVDDSGVEVKMTLWGDKATSNPEQWEGYPVIAFKGVKVSDYNGRSLSTFPSTQMLVNPDLEQAYNLRHWWDNAGSTTATTSISTSGGGGVVSFDRRNYISQIKDEHLGFDDKPDIITVKATINFIKHDTDPYYRACTTPDCKRKVNEAMDGGYRCEKCEKTMSECVYRYIVTMMVADHTASSYVTCFDNEAQTILGKKADEINELKQGGMESEYESIFSEANFKTFVLKIRVKNEMVNDEQRIKCSVMAVRPVDYAQECRDLLAAIDSYN